jgi:hypothetical protein
MIGVIGGGIFGAMAALKLRSSGFNVTIFERQNDILLGASKNNQNRLHLGFHYPRSSETARQCKAGFDHFKQEFPDCIDGSFPNAYFIASEGSMTSAQQYFEFCDSEGLPYTRIDPKTFQVPVANVDAGLICPEMVYDAELLRQRLKERLHEAGIDVMTGIDIQKVSKTETGFELIDTSGQVNSVNAIANCSYASNNGLASSLGCSVEPKQFEYTVIPIIRADMERVGVTIMDGNFMTLLPYGKSNDFLIYHVGHSVIDTKEEIGIDPAWLDKETSPFSKIDKEEYSAKFLADCQKFLPSLRDAKIIGYLEGPRVVLRNKNSTDTRPSIIDELAPGYFSIFSGKIDHCVWVAEDLSERCKASFSM